MSSIAARGTNDSQSGLTQKESIKMSAAIDDSARDGRKAQRAKAVKRKMAVSNQQVSKRKISWEDLARMKEQAAKR